MGKPYTTLRLLSHWILVTACGPIVAAVIVVVAMEIGISWAHALPVAFVVCGLLMGLGQWVVLSARLKRVWPWIPLTAVGFPGGFVLGSFTSLIIDEVDPYLTMSLVLGTLLGGFQWLVLSKKVRNSIWWIPASILSWVIGINLTLASLDLINFTDFLRGIDFILLLGILLGVFVGILGAVPVALLLRKTGIIQTTHPNR
jgi:hypothetical protein